MEYTVGEWKVGGKCGSDHAKLLQKLSLLFVNIFWSVWFLVKKINDTVNFGSIFTILKCWCMVWLLDNESVCLVIFVLKKTKCYMDSYSCSCEGKNSCFPLHEIPWTILSSGYKCMAVFHTPSSSETPAGCVLQINSILTLSGDPTD